MAAICLVYYGYDTRKSSKSTAATNLKSHVRNLYMLERCHALQFTTAALLSHSRPFLHPLTTSVFSCTPAAGFLLCFLLLSTHMQCLVLSVPVPKAEPYS